MSAYDSESLSGLPGESPNRGQRLSLPHFFFDDSGGDTEIQVVNADPDEVQLDFRVNIDGVAEPEVHTLRLGGHGLAVVSVRELLGRAAVPGVATGDLELTATGRDGAEAIYTKVVAQATFIGNGGRARAAAPLLLQGAETWVFPAVLQQREVGFCTGLALLNPRDQALPVTVRAFDDQGQLTAERALEIPAGQRVVGQLDGDVFFGPGLFADGRLPRSHRRRLVHGSSLLRGPTGGIPEPHRPGASVGKTGRAEEEKRGPARPSRGARKKGTATRFSCSLSRAGLPYPRG